MTDLLLRTAEAHIQAACMEVHYVAEQAGLTVDQAAEALTDAGYSGLAGEYRSWAEVWA